MASMIVMDASAIFMTKRQTSADFLMTMILNLNGCAVRVGVVRRKGASHQLLSAGHYRRDKHLLTQLLIDIQPPPHASMFHEGVLTQRELPSQALKPVLQEIQIRKVLLAQHDWKKGQLLQRARLAVLHLMRMR